MKKFLIIICLLFMLPAHADQFKYIGDGITLNRDQVFYIQKVSKNCITIKSNYVSFTLSYKNVQDRNNKYDEIIKWLNEKPIQYDNLK